MPVNSLISAPATKPLFLAEITTAPRGRSFSSAASRPSSSPSTPLESTLAEVPGLSIVSQAIASASRSSFQAAVAVSFMSGRRSRARRGAGADLEIAHQRAMIREAHVRHAEIRDLDAFAHQDEVELDARHARRKGGEACGIGAAQARRTHEEVDLVRAPEGIEVTGHDHRLRRLHDQIVQRAQLVVPLPELQRQVHEEHAHVRQLQLDDQPLDPGIEIVEALAVHVRGGQEGERFHNFDTGIKRLIIELELSDVCVFLVHLSLKFRQRHYQLRSLHDLIVQAAKPVIVAGDFNTFWGTHEIYLFMRAAGLRSANTAGPPPLPARGPRIELDFILVSEGIEVTDFRVPDVRLSDHRPLVCDFQIRASAPARAASAA